MADYLTAARDAYAAGPAAAAPSTAYQSPNQPLPEPPAAAAGGAMGGAAPDPIDYSVPFAIDHATGQLFAGGKPVPTDIAQWQAVAADPSKIAPMPRSLILQHNLTPLTADQLHAAIDQITQYATAPILSNVGAGLRSGARAAGDALARFDAKTNELTGAGLHAIGADYLGNAFDAQAHNTRQALAQWQTDQNADTTATRAGLTLPEQAGNDAGLVQHPGTYVASKLASFAGAAGPAIGAMAINPALGAGVITAQSGGSAAMDSEQRVRAALQAMTPEQLAAQSPLYAQLRHQGMGDATAREHLVSSAGDTAGSVGAGIGAATTALYDIGGKGLSAMAPSITARLAGAGGDSFVARALTGQGLAGVPVRAAVRGVEGAAVMQGQTMASNAAGAAAAGVGSTNPLHYFDPAAAVQSAVGFGAMGALTPMHQNPVAIAAASDIGAATAADAAHTDYVDAATAQAAPAAGVTPDLFGGPARAPTPPAAAEPAPPRAPYNPAQGTLVPDVGPQPQPAHGPLIQQRMDELANPSLPSSTPVAALPPPGPTAAQHDAVASLTKSLGLVNQMLDSGQFNKRTKTGKATLGQLSAERIRLESELKQAGDAVLGQQIGMAREGRPEPTGATFIGDPASGQQELNLGPGHEPGGDPRLTGQALPVDYKPGTSVEPPPLPNPEPMSVAEAQSRLQAQRARTPGKQPPQADLFPQQLRRELAQRAAPPQPVPEGVTPSTPEPAADLQAQADRLGKGSDAMFVAKGNELQLPRVRKGVRTVVRPEGTLFTTNPKKAAQFRTAPQLDDAMLAQLQGLPETKADAMQSPDASVVAAEDAKGNVVKEALGTPGGPNDAVVAAATPKGGKTVRRTALQAQNRRTAKLAADGVPPGPAPLEGVPTEPAPGVARSRLDMIKDAAASKKAAARAGLKKKVPVTTEELAPHDAPADIAKQTKAATAALLDDVAANHPQYLADEPVDAAAGPGRVATPAVIRIPLTHNELGELTERVLATATHEAAQIDAGQWAPRTSAMRRILSTMGVDIPRETELRDVVKQMAAMPVDTLRQLMAKVAPRVVDSTLMKGIVRGVDVIQHAVAETDRSKQGTVGRATPEEPSDALEAAHVNAMTTGKGRTPTTVPAPQPDAAASTARVKVYTDGVPTNTADVVEHWLKVLDKHGETFTAPVHLMTPDQATARYGALPGMADAEGFSGTAKGPTGQAEPFIALDWKALGEGPAAVEALAHEMGHLVERRIFDTLHTEDKASVRSAFNDWLQTSGRGTPTEQMISRLPPALGDVMRTTAAAPDRAYASEWREWIADETAKWLLTADKPRTGVERFFARIASALKALYAQVAGGGRPTEAVQRVFDNWAARSRDLGSADAAARAIDMNYGRDGTEAPKAPELARATIAVKAMRAKAAATAGAAQLRTTLDEALAGNPAGIKRAINHAAVGIMHGKAGGVIQKTVVALSNMNDIVGRYGGKEHGAFGEGLTRWDHAMRLAEKHAKDAQQQGQLAIEQAQRLSAPVGRALEDLMYKTTVYGIHPDEAFGTGRNKHLDDPEASVREANQRRYGEVVAAWNKLRGITGNPQRVYSLLREAMTRMHENLFEARRDNIEALDISDEAKEEAHRLLNVAEAQRLQGPYFPLVRDGNYITTVLMPQKSLGIFDTLAEAKAAERRAKAINPHVTVSIEQADGEFVAHAAERAIYYHATLADALAARKGIETELREAWGHEGMGKHFDTLLNDESVPMISQPMGTLDYFRKAETPTTGSFMTAVNRLNDDGHLDPQAYKMLSEMYVDSLPEASPRKALLHRENVRGASTNMLAGYSRRLLGAAHSYGQTLIGPERNKAWSLMAKHRGADPQYAGVMNTLTNRQKILAERMSSDPTNRMASTIQDASSFLSLGFSPAFLVQQIMQPLVVSAPVIAARMGVNGKAVGYAKTMDALKTAYEGAVPFFTKRGADQFMTEMKRALGTYGGDGLTLQQSAEALIQKFGKTDDERALLRYMNDRGTLDFSFLNAVTDATTLSAAGAKAKAVLRMSMAFPQQVEAMNRSVTGLAAYRLAMAERGMEHGDAVREANTIVSQTHGDYSRYNRPSVFNRPLLGMALQFKMYTQFMYSLLASNIAHGMDPRLSRAERAQAWRTLGYVLGSHAAFGGLVGLGPVAGAAKFALGGVLWAAASAGLIDKKKKDQTTADYVAAGFEDWGDDMFGKGAGHELRAVGTYGLPALMGIDFADKIGLPDITDTKFTGKPSAKDQPSSTLDRIALTALGPVYSNLKRVVNGTGALLAGDVHGAAKQILPPAPRAWLNAATEAQDGIVTPQGKVLKASKDISPYDTFIRAMGFSTTDTALMYDDRARRQDAIDRYQATRDDLVAAYRDPAKRADALAKISEWNAGQPKELQISSATLHRALDPKAQQPSKLEQAAARAIGQKNPR